MISFTTSIFILGLVAQAYPYSICKPTAEASHWPSVSAWDKLNNTLNGRLITPGVPAAVCYTSRLEYSPSQCAVIEAQWSNTSFHASNPVSVDYNDDTCPPVGNATCSSAGYPAYIIDARSAHDIQIGVTFARETDVRLVIKATGHDLVGR
jgi:hypothetical protein